MSQIFLAVFLLVFGFNLLIGVALPGWVVGALALVSGILLLAERFAVKSKDC